MALTDREMMMQAQEEAEAAQHAMQVVRDWELQGVGAAAFVRGMLAGLGGLELDAEAKLGLVRAALRGR